jgi:hypothetical protein
MFLYLLLLMLLSHRLHAASQHSILEPASTNTGFGQDFMQGFLDLDSSRLALD